MAHYIDADALKIEIKHHIELMENEPTSYAKARIDEANEVLSVIDSLQQEQPEAPVDGEVHHALNCHYLATDDMQLCARLREFPEGAKVDIFIIAKEDK